MKRSTTRWTTALAAAALLGLPAGGWAQTPSPTTQPAKSAPSQAPSATNATHGNSAQKHLQLAKTAIDGISPEAVTGKMKTQLVEVKTHMFALDRAPAVTTPTGTSGKKTTRATTATAGWAKDVAEIDRILTSLIGTTGKTGATAAAAPGAPDEATRGKLADAKTHIIAFAAAMSGTEAAAADAAATNAAAPAAGPDSVSTSKAAESASKATENTAPGSSKAATPPVDQEAARTQMTEARNTLTQLTQLPASAQLAGEARAQVTQVIANFNELITTTHDWPVSYAKVEANLNALLGPESADPEPAGGVATGTSGATVPGAVGTSGAAPVPTLDPAVRAKLIELRAHLKAYGKAAGGVPKSAAATAPTSSAVPDSAVTRPTSADPASTTAATPATAPPPTPEVTPAPAPISAVALTTAPTPSPAVAPATAPAPPSATPAAAATTAAAPAPTPAATPSTAPAPAMAQPPQVSADKAGHDAALRHIEAIEAILNGTGAVAAGTPGTAGTSGTKLPTKLDRAQLEQLRMHISELKLLVEKQ